MPPILQNDPQLLDLARLLDAPKAESSQAPSAAEADAEEADPGNDLSQHAEHDGDEPEADAPAADADESPETDAEESESDAAESEADPDDESVTPPKGLTPAAQHAFNKAIAKEKSRRRDLVSQLTEREAEIERLQAELNGLAAAQPEPGAATEPPLLAKAKSADEVEKLSNDAVAWECAWLMVSSQQCGPGPAAMCLTPIPRKGIFQA